MAKIIRMTTIPTSLYTFIEGQLSALREAGHDVLAVSSPGWELQAISEREGVPHAVVPMVRHISPLNDLKSLWKMYRLFRREKPTIVHTMTPKAGLIGMMAARLAGVPVRIHTFTGLVWPTQHGIKKKLLMSTDSILCRCATHIVPEGHGVKRILANAKITDKPLHILAHGNVRGINGEYFDRTPWVMQEAAKIREQGCYTFVFVGRLVTDKGIPELVRAFHAINEPDIRLLLVGRYEPSLDPLPADVHSIIQTDTRITATGQLEEVRPWYAAGDAFIFPSHREGFPNALLEAGAMGLPVFSTAVNGADEIIKQGQTGVVFPLLSTEELRQECLYKQMTAILSHRDQAAAMGARARQHVLAHWSSEIVLKALMDFYTNILNTRH